MVDVIRSRTDGADASSPPATQKPASPHTEASAPAGTRAATPAAGGSPSVKGSIPFDELPDPLAYRRPWSEPSRLLEICRVGECCRHVSRLERKEIPYRLLAECLLEQRDHLE